MIVLPSRLLTGLMGRSVRGCFSALKRVDNYSNAALLGREASRPFLLHGSQFRRSLAAAASAFFSTDVFRLRRLLGDLIGVFCQIGGSVEVAVSSEATSSM